MKKIKVKTKSLYQDHLSDEDFELYDKHRDKIFKKTVSGDFFHGAEKIDRKVAKIGRKIDDTIQGWFLALFGMMFRELIIVPITALFRFITTVNWIAVVKTIFYFIKYNSTRLYKFIRYR